MRMVSWHDFNVHEITLFITPPPPNKSKVAVEKLVLKLKRNTDASLHCNQEIEDDFKFLIKH